MSLRLIKRLRYNLTSCEDLRFYKKAGNLREHHLLISIQPPALEKVGTHPTSITYILGYCKTLVKPNTQSSASALTLEWHIGDAHDGVFYELCPEESVDDGCLRLPVHLSFIVQETIGDLAPTNLHSTSEKLQLGISFQERVQTGRATPKEWCKGNKIEYISNLWKRFFFVSCTPYNEACYIWLPLWTTSPMPPMGLTFY